MKENYWENQPVILQHKPSRLKNIRDKEEHMITTDNK